MARLRQSQTINGHVHHVVFLKRIEQPVQNTRICPTVQPDVNGVPFAESLGQSPSFSTVLDNEEDRTCHG